MWRGLQGRAILRVVGLAMGVTLVSTLCGCTLPTQVKSSVDTSTTPSASAKVKVPAFGDIAGKSSTTGIRDGTALSYGDPAYLSQYQAIADAAGLELRFRTVPGNDPAFSGPAASWPPDQEPAAGTMVERGSEVTLTVVTASSSAVEPKDGSGADTSKPSPASHQGESFYAVICESSASKAEAQKRLNDLNSLLGDTGGGFFIDKSDHYEGMRPGWWVVFSAYESKSDAAEDAKWFTRGSFEPYVKSVKKRCTDPIDIVASGRDL